MNNCEKMALGRRAAYLRRCIQAQEILEREESGITIRKRIFDRFIHPTMGCSYATFNNMLNEKNPRRELERIELKLKVK